MDYSNAILLYVDDAEASAKFYARLLGQDPLEANPGFAIFRLPTGLGLGLWQRADVEPAVVERAGGSEIGFAVGAPGDVDAAHEDWAAKEVEILMPPRDLDFGRSFMGLDPDGHRLRVYSLSS